MSTPYSMPQMAAWVALLLSLFEFILFVSPLMPVESAVPLTVYFVSLVAGVLYYGARTQLIDPIDVHLSKDLRAVCKDASVDYFDIAGSVLPKLYRRLNPEMTSIPEEEMKQCWICDTMVAEHSMHCKFCNKCIYHFDHHCMCKYEQLLPLLELNDSHTLTQGSIHALVHTITRTFSGLCVLFSLWKYRIL